ncbi:hypothetical protein M8C21_013325 [Ambrosia artemisiifolia]|uniref:Uncharacterized protein n=1 Tax=Ambrosia artemisiifolia TaxID=4212 RepID=A0AAD5G886_AMBAR|nr:hypothetical protein M8C21_013325 [Ambrosia artemisiifolia]
MCAGFFLDFQFDERERERETDRQREFESEREITLSERERPVVLALLSSLTMDETNTFLVNVTSSSCPLRHYQFIIASISILLQHRKAGLMYKLIRVSPVTIQHATPGV